MKYCVSRIAPVSALESRMFYFSANECYSFTLSGTVTPGGDFSGPMIFSLEDNVKTKTGFYSEEISEQVYGKFDLFDCRLRFLYIAPSDVPEHYLSNLFEFSIVPSSSESYPCVYRSFMDLRNGVVYDYVLPSVKGIDIMNGNNVVIRLRNPVAIGIVFVYFNCYYRYSH